MGSSRSTRNAQRATAGGEIVALSVGTYIPAGAIPVKFAQALGAFGMFVRPQNNSKRDRALHGVQCVLATAQVVVASYLFFNNQTCDSNSRDPMCSSALWLSLIYHGTLLTGWGLSELIRQPGLDSSSSVGSSYSSLQSMVIAPHSGPGQTMQIPHAPQTPKPDPMGRARRYLDSRPDPLSIESATGSQDNSVVSDSTVVVVSPQQERSVSSSRAPLNRLVLNDSSLPESIDSYGAFEFVERPTSRNPLPTPRRDEPQKRSESNPGKSAFELVEMTPELERVTNSY